MNAYNNGNTTISTFPTNYIDTNTDWTFTGPAGTGLGTAWRELAPVSCTSPKAYSGLMVGTEYTFSVWATDASGNTDATPATSTFTLLDTRTNVRAFGATGNGTSNDTAAFERAMAEAARVGGVVYVPAPGNYRIANMTPLSNTRLQVQAGAVLKKYGSANGPLFNIAGSNDTTFVNNVHI